MRGIRVVVEVEHLHGLTGTVSEALRNSNPLCGDDRRRPGCRPWGVLDSMATKRRFAEPTEGLGEAPDLELRHDAHRGRPVPGAVRCAARRRARGQGRSDRLTRLAGLRVLFPPMLKTRSMLRFASSSPLRAPRLVVHRPLEEADRVLDAQPMVGDSLPQILE